MDNLTICEKCPGTYWGTQTNCIVHKMHIGKITKCPEWRRERVRNMHSKFNEAYEMLKDYRWMQIEIARLEVFLKVSEPSPTTTDISLILDKKMRNKTDLTQMQALNRTDTINRLEKLKAKVALVDKAIGSLVNEKQIMIAHGIMEGMRLTTIAENMGLSRQRVWVLRVDMIDQIAEVIFG